MYNVKSKLKPAEKILKHKLQKNKIVLLPMHCDLAAAGLLARGVGESPGPGGLCQWLSLSQLPWDSTQAGSSTQDPTTHIKASTEGSLHQYSDLPTSAYSCLSRT